MDLLWEMVVSNRLLQCGLIANVERTKLLGSAPEDTLQHVQTAKLGDEGSQSSADN